MPGGGCHPSPEIDRCVRHGAQWTRIDTDGAISPRNIQGAKAPHRKSLTAF